MPELRKDPIVERWVIVNTENPYTPSDFHIEEHVWKGEENCPFCGGHEGLTPAEIEVVRDQSGAPNSTGWKVRVVPNKFPALRIEGDLDKHGVGVFDRLNGIGAHEVIIDSPYHFKGIADLTADELTLVMRAYRSRSIDLRKDKRFKYILIFKNVGAPAGASLEHGHSQLIALPMIPKNVHEELLGTRNYHSYHDRCIFCDIIAQELENGGDRIVVDNKEFLSICPLSSRFPFEVWIIPKKHSPDFATISDDQISYLAPTLKEVIQRLNKVFKGPSFNYIIHTAPVNTEAFEEYHWHIEIMPKLTRVAGFEWGSGFYLVPTPPEMAARYLKDAKINAE